MRVMRVMPHHCRVYRRGRRHGLHRRWWLWDRMQLWLPPHLLRLGPDNLVPEELVKPHPLDWVPLEQPADQLLQSATDWKRPNAALGCGRRPARLLVREPDPILASLDLLEELNVVLGLERWATDRHLEENSPDGPKVGLGVVLLVPQNLGRHVQPNEERLDKFSSVRQSKLSQIIRLVTHGEPHSVSAMLAPSRNRANPKSATLRTGIPSG